LPYSPRIKYSYVQPPLARDEVEMINLAEQFAEAYWERNGLKAERFSAAEIGRGKTPDFRIYKSDALVAYCEAKHVQHDDWLDQKLKTAKPLELVGGRRHDPIFNRIVGHIHKAYKQFTAVNPNREYPNVLVFMNSDMQCDNRDLVAVMTGNFYMEGGGAESIYTAYSEGRIKEEKFAIDLYLWFDESKGDTQRGFHYFIANGPHYVALCALLGSDPSKHVRP
jgi:hypothetical protein